MPAIRITYSENSLTAEQKAELAPLLIDAVMQQEVSPITDAARHITAVVFNEVPQHNSFGAQSFWLVEAMIAAGFLNQARRDAAQVAIGKAFVKVLGDDGSSIELGGKTVSPAYLAHLVALMIEIPEGSWGAEGHTLSSPEIGQVIGTDKHPERWSELQQNSSKLSASRPS